MDGTVRKGKSSAAARSLLTIEQDLSSFDESHFLEFNPQLDVPSNLNKTFDFFVVKSKLNPEMTKAELEMFAWSFKERRWTR